MGHDLLDIRNIYMGTRSPLLGPPTSHPWLNFGPIFYWLALPVLIIFRFDPMSMGYFIAFMSALLILENFYFVKKLISEKVAIISSFLIAISPGFLDMSRQARFYSLVPLLLYPYIYFLPLNTFLSGLSLGFMLNFHLSALVLLPAWLLYRKNLKSFICGLLIPQIPIVIYSAQNNFEMLGKFIAWIPYRIITQYALPPSSNSFSPLYFLNRVIASPENNYVLNGIIFLLFILIAKNKNLLLILAGGLLLVLLHGKPPYHYYLPLYPLPLILLAKGLDKYRMIGAIILSVILVSNINFLFSNKWFFLPQNEYANMKQFIKDIINDAKDSKYTMRRVGEFDYYEDNYAHNYRYLLWWMGNEPMANAKTLYTIYDRNALYFTKEER